MDYTPHTAAQITQMLERIGVKGVEELLADIPPEVRCKAFDVPEGLAESQITRACEALGAENRALDRMVSFLGFGAYQHLIPAAVDALASRGEWLTPYTPYQAEASQGTLQMTYEFQTMICELTGMELANASLYDGASSLAEAVVMALRSSRRPRVLVTESVHPHARQVMATYLSGMPCVIQEIPHVNGITDLEALAAALKDDVAAVVVQQPNAFGCLEPVDEISRMAHEHGALLISSVYPVSLGLLKPPGAYGADVAVGEGRCLGSPLAYGGPGLGLFATTSEFLRKVPGRLAGCTVDQAGRRSFTLTLQTREQHIRREQATSNICTNEGWLCVRAAIFMSLLGPAGLKELALLNTQKAHELQARLSQLTCVRPIFDRPFFNEFVVQYQAPLTVDTVNRALLRAGIMGGLALEPWYPMLPETALWCVTEHVTSTQMDRAVDTLRELAATP